LTINALLAVAMQQRKAIRTVHAYEGRATLSVAAVQMVLGVQLGLSF
jgi:hypothetical protein